MERQDTDTWTHDPEQLQAMRERQSAMLARIPRQDIPRLRPRITPGVIVMLVAFFVIVALALLGVR